MEKLREWETVLTSVEATQDIAKRLGNHLSGGELITLAGNLGAGKTTFTKGLAVGLGIKRAVTSPTFTIMKEYTGRLKLNHIDAYRLEHAEEDVGLDDYLYGEDVTVIEWAVFVEEFLPEERLAICLEYINETTRKIVVEATGVRYETLLAEIVRGNRTVKF